jgi:histidine kinase
MNGYRLYGRSNETRILQEALAASTVGHCAPHLVILTGPAGVGKRALAESLRPLVESTVHGGGLFLSGRCRPTDDDSPLEQRRHARPSVAFCEVIEDLVDSSNEGMKQTLRSVIASQLFSPSELESLSEILVSVDRLLRSNMATPSRPSAAAAAATTPAFLRGINSAQERCRLLARFIRAATTCVPLVLHLHQTQCADASSVQLLECLLSDDIDFQESTKGLLIVASIQDGTALSQPMERFLEQFSTPESTGSKKKIHLQLQVLNISKEEVFQWTKDRLSGEGATYDLSAIADLIYNHSSGNPQFVRYLLGYLQNSLVVTFDEDTLEAVRSQLPSKIDEMFKLVVQQQDSLVQSLVETVAAIKECGGTVDAQIIELVLGQSCSQALEAAQSCGVLELVHDRIRFCLPESQVTAYSMIPESRRASVHLNIGWAIWEQYSQIADDPTKPYVAKWLNLMACQLQRGATGVKNDEELFSIANINFSAGKKAMQSSDFSSAASHFDFAISVLGDDKWKTDRYDICLALHNYGAEAYYCIGDFENMDRMLTAVLENAISFRDKLQAYTAQVYTNGARHRLKEAVATALEVLRKLGEPVPSNPGKLAVAADYFKTRWLLRSKTDRFFLGLPDATNGDKIAAMQMLNFLCVYSYVSKPELGALAVFRILRLSVRYGITGPAVPAYSAYGFLLCAHMGRIMEGYRFGQIALSLLDQCEAKAWLPRIYFYAHGLTNRWVKPLRESLSPLRQAHQSALNTGDYEGSVLTASTYVMLMFFAGKSLSFMEQESRSFCQSMDSLGQNLGLLFVVPRWSFFCDLAGGSQCMPLELSGEVQDAESALRVATRENNKLAMFTYYANVAIFSVHCGEYEEALDFSQKARNSSPHTDFGHVFYEGLAALAVATKGKRKTRPKYTSLGRLAAKRFKKWASICPENFRNKQYLLEAELASIEGKGDIAAALFGKSIEAANKEGFIHEEALAYERLGHFLHLRDDATRSVESYEKARDAYKLWGSETLVSRIEATLQTVESARKMPEQTP